MQPRAVAHASLNGMAEGMSEIENGAQTRLPLVSAHHLRLDFTAAPDGMGQRLRLAGAQCGQMRLDPIKESHVGNRAIFDDFSQTSGKLARRQGFDCVQIAHNPLRLIERANHVFAQRVVDGRFPAHRRVHLRQQRSWHLHERHATHIAGCGKACDVAYHAAAQSVKRSFAVCSLLKQGVKNQVQRLPILVSLAIRQRQDLHTGMAAR